MWLYIGNNTTYRHSYYKTWLEKSHVIYRIVCWYDMSSDIHVSQKNMPTLASCSFNKRGLILIILGKQHHIELSLNLQFYLVYLLLLCMYLFLNSCDRNDTFTYTQWAVEKAMYDKGLHYGPLRPFKLISIGSNWKSVCSFLY